MLTWILWAQLTMVVMGPCPDCPWIHPQTPFVLSQLFVSHEACAERLWYYRQSFPSAVPGTSGVRWRFWCAPHTGEV